MMRDDKTRRPIPGPAFGYDKVAFRESAEILENDGLNMVDVPMNPSTFAPASTQTYELITTGRVAHEGDVVFGEHIANTMAKLTERGMVVMRPKSPSTRANTLCVALVRGVALAMQEPPKPFVARPARPQAVGF
jgi:phage terminase large subunit-like protein